ncbi:MAG: S1 RNA-binding domain-containing protein, partial [Eubacteriaceae bacterium]
MKLGTEQTMTVDHMTDHGAFLKENPEDNNSILLPQAEIRRAGRKIEPGDELNVFLYKDSEDRPTATLKHPKIELGGFAPLKVKSVTGIGAFLDWGLDKDLLLPYSEQTVKVMQGRDYLVSLYEDKSGRLAATMKVYPLLKTDSNLKKGEWTEGYVYQINPDFGAFLAVDNQYNGMIRKEDMNDEIRNGKTVKVRVTGIRKDGKLMLSPVKKAYKEIG